MSLFDVSIARRYPFPRKAFLLGAMVFFFFFFSKIDIVQPRTDASESRSTRKQRFRIERIHWEIEEKLQRENTRFVRTSKQTEENRAISNRLRFRDVATLRVF